MFGRLVGVHVRVCMRARQRVSLEFFPARVTSIGSSTARWSMPTSSLPAPSSRPATAAVFLSICFVSPFFIFFFLFLSFFSHVFLSFLRFFV